MHSQRTQSDSTPKIHHANFAGIVSAWVSVVPDAPSVVVSSPESAKPHFFISWQYLHSERDIGPRLGFRVWQNNHIEYNLFCLHSGTQLDKATTHYTIEFTQISEWIERRNLGDFRYMGVFGVRSTRKVLACLFVMAFTSQGKTGEEGRSDWKFEVL